jgi:DNA-binding response OmpR family regulator
MMKVLIVEDERTLSMIIADTLRDEGFDVAQAYDGNQGLSSMRVHHPDVVIADVMMPHMDGFEMVRQMRKTDKTTPVLFLTARSSTDDLVAGFKLGANDYLKKPFTMQELIIRVKALVNKAMQLETTSHG